MRSEFKTVRARLAASVTALLGLSVVAGCERRAPEQASPEISAPNAATAPRPNTNGVTTLAIGEEDGGYGAPIDSGMATTLAVGEEDGTGPFPVEAGGGIGDGAGPPPFDGSSTTYDIGEEDDVQIFIPPDPDNAAPAVDYGQVTTLAIGEEG